MDIEQLNALLVLLAEISQLLETVKVILSNYTASSSRQYSEDYKQVYYTKFNIKPDGDQLD